MSRQIHILWTDDEIDMLKPYTFPVQIATDWIQIQIPDSF